MMVDSLVKNKMCSEPVYVDSFSAFQLLRYNNILAPKGTGVLGFSFHLIYLHGWSMVSIKNDFNEPPLTKTTAHFSIFWLSAPKMGTIRYSIFPNLFFALSYLQILSSFITSQNIFGKSSFRLFDNIQITHVS